jgi:hypothetical protein
VRPALKRWVERHGLSFAAASRNGGAVLLALLVAEVILRKPWLPEVRPNSDNYCPPIVLNDRYGWELRPSTICTRKIEGRDILFSIDAEGNRSKAVDLKRDHERPTILIGGESIALGVGLPYEESFASLLEERSGIQVVDTGVYRYDMGQVYLREKEVLESYAHPIAIVTVFIADEASRAEFEDRTRLRVDGEGTLRLVPPTPSWIEQIRLRRLWRDTYHGDGEVEDMRATARATVNLARAHGAYPLFVTTNFIEQCLDVKGEKPRLFRTIFDDQKIARVHVDVPASERLASDSHPGAAAHERMADGVLQALRDAHVL